MSARSRGPPCSSASVAIDARPLSIAGVCATLMAQDQANTAEAPAITRNILRRFSP